MEFIKKNTKIYVIGGKARSGKDTVAGMIKNKLSNTVILSYASYLKMYAKEILGWDGSDPKPRDFLQQLGVELIKNQIDDKFLINRIIEDIKVYSYFYDVIIISDARFVDEIESIRNNFDNVTVIHMSERDSELTDSEKKHATETGLDKYHDYDYEICEDNLDSLKERVEEIVGETYGSSN